MSHEYVIIERLGRREDGVVPHDIQIDGAVRIPGVSYLEARDYVKREMKADDTMYEVYESTGNRTTVSTGKLVE